MVDPVVMDKPTIVLLHGALGSGAQMIPLAERLLSRYRVEMPDFPGHGGTEIPSGGYRMADLVAGLSDWMDRHLSGPAIVFGYSMGGYAATALALERPEHFTRIITLGTKWHWTPEVAVREAKMLDPTAMLEKVPALVTLLSERHAPQDWKAITQATSQLLEGLGQEPLLRDDDLHGCVIPVDILWGTEDRLVSRDESERVAGILPNGQFHTMPGQRHPLEQVDPGLLSDLILELISIR